MLIVSFVVLLLVLRAVGFKASGSRGDLHDESYLPKKVNRYGDLVKWYEPY